MLGRVGSGRKPGLGLDLAPPTGDHWADALHRHSCRNAGGNTQKALALLSGGLDSGLAAKLVLDQGVEVVGVKFTSPFCRCDQQGRCFAREAADQLGIPLRTVSKGADYLEVVRHPKHGYGSGMNPCIDCRIFMHRKAWAIAREVGARFLVTGEVLGQRPMSQRLWAMRTIDRESGLEGKVLRPLSARHLAETEAEQQGWVQREKLLAFRGRTRKPQLALARQVGLDVFACPAGGCLLTMKQFAARLRDLFDHRREVGWRDVQLLTVGRHFRLGPNKIVVGRNEIENRVVLATRQPTDYVFEAPDCGSPVTVLQGTKSRAAVTTAAALTVRYADCTGRTRVKYGTARPVRGIEAEPLDPAEVDRLRLPDFKK